MRGRFGGKEQDMRCHTNRKDQIRNDEHWKIPKMKNVRLNKISIILEFCAISLRRHFFSLSLIRSLISAIYLPLRTYTLSALACHHWLVVIFSRTPWSVLVFHEMKQFRILVKNSFKMLSVSIDRPSLLLLLLLFGRDFSPFKWRIFCTNQ